MSIAIIDYGAGNLRSVEKAIAKLGFSPEITRDRTTIRNAKGIILPGVGSFDPAISELRSLGLESVIEEAIAVGKPFLGICLGLQHLFDSSEEGKLGGLGILKGKVVRFALSAQPELSIPHMGWNRLIVKRRSPILAGIEDGSMVYFAHTYHVQPKDDIIISTTTDYGYDFASSVWKDNLFGIQFHPEKSGEVGLAILKNFGGLCK